MAVGSQVELGDEAAECCTVALVEDLSELLEQGGIGSELDDRLSEQAWIGLIDGYGWSAELHTEENAFLAANPLADVATAGEQAELVEQGLIRLRITGAKGVVESGEDLLVFADL